MGDISCSNGNEVNGKSHSLAGYRKSCWYEEEIEENLRWCFALNRCVDKILKKLHKEAKEVTPFIWHFAYRSYAVPGHCTAGHEALWEGLKFYIRGIFKIYILYHTPALVIDGKLQSAEIDEFIYHESLVHPALLHHPNPKSIFIMGGGEGSTAREILRHKTVEKVVMCDIDEEVVDFCKSYLVVNREAFCDPRLELVINDARAELESREECFDVIIGDLADPIKGGPCYQLYTKSFYESTVKPRLSPGGIFVTQAGPAGVFSHTEVFSCIHNTLRQVFKHVVAYSAHIPSFADIWGWVMASDSPFLLNAEELDLRMKQRIKGENRYIDGKTFSSASTLSKVVRTS
uniref:Uncharacterized protein n=1 Tax=Vitis vinifera TaxID=29760 RepID=A5BNU0_VITVI|nr:hypothetical protein VITISV_036382 [Vitis vinifera]